MKKAAVTPGGLTQEQIDVLRERAASGIDDPVQRKKMGRPSSYTKKKAKIILEAIELGRSPGTAAMLAGISRTTLFNWLDKGKAILEALDSAENADTYEPTDVSDWDFLDFLYRYWQALGSFAAEVETTLGLGLANDPDLALRVLQIRFPQDYQGKQETTVTLKGDQDNPVKHEHTHEVNVNQESPLDFIATLLSALKEGGVLDSLDLELDT